MKKKTCALAEKALSAGDASARAPRVSDSFAAADVRDGVAEVHVVKHVVKKIMSLSMMKKRSLRVLTCAPVSRRVLRACVSAVRVREK